MHMIFELFMRQDFYFALLRLATPVLLTTMGAIVASSAGSSNIALEGTMLFSAFAGVFCSALSQNPWIGLLGAALCGFLISSVLAYFALKLKSNIVITGIALNLFSAGATVFLLYLATGDKGASTSLPSKILPNLQIPFVRDIPVIGGILSGHHILTYVGLLSVFAVYYLLRYTLLGLHIRAVGQFPEAARSAGISVERIKYISLSISGVMAGLGGAFLSMGYVSLFSAGMTNGRGYIALATQAMAAGNAFVGLFTSLLFGLCESLSIYLQGGGLPIEWIQMIPYLTIVIVYTIYTANRKEG